MALVKNGKKTILYGPLDRNGSLSRFGARTRGESPARTLSRRPLPDLEPKTYLWRYFAEPLRLRVLVNRWRRYTPVAVILLSHWTSNGLAGATKNDSHGRRGFKSPCDPSPLTVNRPRSNFPVLRFDLLRPPPQRPLFSKKGYVG